MDSSPVCGVTHIRSRENCQFGNFSACAETFSAGLSSFPLSGLSPCRAYQNLTDKNNEPDGHHAAEINIPMKPSNVNPRGLNLPNGLEKCATAGAEPRYAQCLLFWTDTVDAYSEDYSLCFGHDALATPTFECSYGSDWKEIGMSLSCLWPVRRHGLFASFEECEKKSAFG